MDPIQLTIVITTLTLVALIAILSIQVWNILKEIRIGLSKVNKMLDDAGKISGTVSEGVVQMSGFMIGIKAGLSMLTAITAKKGETHE